MTVVLVREELDLPPDPDSSRGRWSWLTGPRVLIAAALLVWAVSLPALSRAKNTDYGLLFSAPWTLAPCVVAVVVAFCWAIRRDSLRDGVLALLALIAIGRATVTLITSIPIYTWTYKHIGVVESIQGGGTLPRVDIYDEWPGAFTATAWFDKLTGLNPVTLAHVFAVGVHLLIVLAVVALSRAMGQSRRVALTAAFIAEATNWVGQDYFSPQAIAYLLGLAIVILLLRADTSRAAVWISVPIFAALTVTHQLTPFWIAGIAVVLGVTGRIRPRWIGFVFVAIILAYVTPRLGEIQKYGLLSGFDPLANAKSNVPTAGNAGRSFSAMADKIPPLALWLSAAVIAVRRRLRHEPVWIPVVLAFSSFVLLGGNSYGGEAIFRVFLYSIPGCALLVAPALVDGLTRRGGGPRARVRRVVTGAIVVVVAVTSLQGYYGGWFTNLVRPDSLAAVQSLMASVNAPALIIPVTTGIPERPTGKYAAFALANGSYDQPLVLDPGIQGLSFDSAADLTRVDDLLSSAHVPTYLIVTAQMKVYSDYYGLFPHGSIDRLQALLAASTHWTTVTATATVAIYRYEGSG